MQLLHDLLYAVGILVAAALVLMFVFYMATFVMPLLITVGIIVVIVTVIRADREGR